MRVILDVNSTSSVSYNVQVCSSVQGFLSIMEMHPEDEFVIDEASADAYVDYMRAKQSAEALWENFCDEMCITKQDYDAMRDYYMNVGPEPDPRYDEELFIDELLADDYYAELQADYEDTIHSLMYC